MKTLLFLFALIFTSSVVFAASTCRKQSVKHRFDKLNGYPYGRKGYVVDHVCALEVGGLDNIKNMQYQTYSDSKTKDKVERTAYGKAKWCNETNSLPYRTVYNCK